MGGRGEQRQAFFVVVRETSVTHAQRPVPDGPVQPDIGTEAEGQETPLVPAPPDQVTVVRRSRAGALWTGLIVAAVILVLLLIFIIQNSQTVEVSYFGLQGRLSLAVAILLGVAAGALLVVIPGTVRILQLRNRVRHGPRR
jgi:uncharacterized integral membrane protein